LKGHSPVKGINPYIVHPFFVKPAWKFLPALFSYRLPEELREKYFEEIRSRPAVIRQLEEAIHAHEKVTFLFSAHDTEHNNAIALKEFLENEPW
jgi:hypothetical protein